MVQKRNRSVTKRHPKVHVVLNLVIYFYFYCVEDSEINCTPQRYFPAE